MKQKKKKRKRKIFLPLFLIFFIIIGFYSHQSYETAMHEQLPDSLIEFEQKYPEATDFVENYHKYKNKSFDLDVSHEVRKDNIPLFIQWDKRWGYKTYGSNFLGVNGCGPTSLSMVICGLTGKQRGILIKWHNFAKTGLLYQWTGHFVGSDDCRCKKAGPYIHRGNHK